VLAGGVRALVLFGLILAWFLPFYLVVGEPALQFLTYHQDRGIEIEALSSSLLMALHALGHDIQVYHAHGCVNIGSAWSPYLAQLSFWLMAALLLAGTVVLWTLVQRAARARADTAKDAAPWATFAQAQAQEFACATLLFLMFFIGASKVFSPQYLLWLAPFVALVPFDRPARRAFLWAFVLVGVLSTLIFPFLFWEHVTGRVSPEPPWTFRGPTILGAMVLGLRNLLFLGMGVGLTLHLVRRYRPVSAASSPAEVTMASARSTLVSQ
jgi:hypothetical protein